MQGPYFVSRRYDFGWFVLPGIVTAAAALVIGLSSGEPESAGLGMWIVGVLLVDVTHVYASLYRTYLDAGARQRHRRRLIWTPILCAGAGFALHALSARHFWPVLAYVAIFHFIKQHVGFAMLYVRAGRESPFDRRLTELTVWAGTLIPIVYWHANPRNFAWFGGDEAGMPLQLPSAAGTLALLAGVPILIVFLARRVQLWRGGTCNPMVAWLTLVPALNWHLGIVFFNDDRIFTLTNLFMHGIPYMALVWITGGRGGVERLLAAPSRPPAEAGAPDELPRLPENVTATASLGRSLAIALVFYGILLALAYTEEALWDRLVWKKYPQLFGASGISIDPESLLGALIVALLAVPQATHYLLDRWIWRVGPDNPELAGQLNLGRFDRCDRP